MQNFLLRNLIYLLWYKNSVTPLHTIITIIDTWKIFSWHHMKLDQEDININLNQLLLPYLKKYKLLLSWSYGLEIWCAKNTFVAAFIFYYTYPTIFGTVRWILLIILYFPSRDHYALILPITLKTFIRSF